MVLMRSKKLLKTLILNCVITIQANVSDANQLILQYSVLNQGTETVVLFNRLHKGFDGKGRPVVDANFVGVMPFANEIVIAKKLFPIPPGRLVEAPYLPYLTKVSPGARFEERIVLNLPLVAWDPYLSTDEIPLPPVGKSLPVYFDLGMFTLPKESVLGMTETTLGPLPSLQAFTESSQRIARLGPLSVSVSVSSKQ